MQFRSQWIKEDQSVPLRGKLQDWYLRKPLSQTLRAVYTRLMSVYYWISIVIKSLRVEIQVKSGNVFRKQSLAEHQ